MEIFLAKEGNHPALAFQDVQPTFNVPDTCWIELAQDNETWMPNTSIVFFIPDSESQWTRAANIRPGLPSTGTMAAGGVPPPR